MRLQEKQWDFCKSEGKTKEIGDLPLDEPDYFACNALIKELTVRIYA